MSVNKVIIVGNCGKDPEIRMVGEAKVASFSVATTEKYKDSKTGEWKENTEWHNIVCWRNSAELAEKYVQKGMLLYIEGKLRTRSWDDKDGNKRYVTEIIADVLQFLGKKEGSDSPAPAPAQQRKPLNQQTSPMPAAGEPDDSDLPF